MPGLACRADNFVRGVHLAPTNDILVCLHREYENLLKGNIELKSVWLFIDQTDSDDIKR